MTGRQARAVGEHVVETQAEGKSESVERGAFQQRNNEIQPVDEVRCYFQEDFPFMKVLVHQFEVKHAEVTEAAVDKAGGTRCCAVSKILFLHK